MSDESTGSARLVRFLETSALIETISAEIYHFLAEAHRDIPEAAALWKKTAIEEEMHVERFHVAARHCTELHASARIPQEEADRVLGRVREMVEELKRKPPGVIPALRLVITMEERLSAFHLENSLEFEDESIKALFGALLREDRAHIVDLNTQLAVFLLDAPEGN